MRKAILTVSLVVAIAGSSGVRLPATNLAFVVKDPSIFTSKTMRHLIYWYSIRALPFLASSHVMSSCFSKAGISLDLFQVTLLVCLLMVVSVLMTCKRNSVTPTFFASLLSSAVPVKRHHDEEGRPTDGAKKRMFTLLLSSPLGLKRVRIHKRERLRNHNNQKEEQRD